MKENCVNYNSKTYNAGKAFLYAFPSFIILVVCILLMGRYFHSVEFLIIGWILICSVPFLFQKKFKNLFTRSIKLEFDSNEFIVKEFKFNSEIFIKETIIKWNEIKSYKSYFSASGITYITLYYRSGRTKTLAIKHEKTQEAAINQRSFFSLFFYFICQYNSQKNIDDQIGFKRGFLTTKAGGVIIYVIMIAAILLIILNIVFKPGTAVFSFMSLFIVLGLIIKRRKDNLFYIKQSDLEPRLID